MAVFRGKRGFSPSYIFTTRRCGDDDQPPKGGEHGPQLRPSFGGLRGLRPCVFPTPTSGAGPLQAMPAASWSRLWRSLRPCGREIPAYQGAQLAAVWVGTSRPASWACERATAAGNAVGEALGTGSAWPRLCRLRLRCALLVPRSRPTAPFFLVGMKGGGPLLAVQAVAGRACPPGGLGVQPPAVEPP